VGAGERDLDGLGLVAQHGHHAVARVEAAITKGVHQTFDPLVELDPGAGAPAIDDGRFVASRCHDVVEQDGHQRPRARGAGSRSWLDGVVAEIGFFMAGT